MKKLILCLILIMLPLAWLTGLPAEVNAEHLDAAKATDLKRRQLITFKECLAELDTDDDYENLQDFFKDIEHNQKEYVVVGLDRDSGNGVQTCGTVVIAGAKALGESGSEAELTNWFARQITGTDFNDHSGSIPNDGDRDKRHRNQLVNRIDRALSNYPASATPREVIASRLYELMYTCYSLRSVRPQETEARDKSNDFEHQLTNGKRVWGIYRGKGTVKDRAQQRLGLRKNDGYTSRTKTELGDIDLDWFWSDNRESDVVWNFDKHFYPFGEDRPNFTGGQYRDGSILSCEFAKNHLGLIFTGAVAVEDGKIITIDGRQEGDAPPEESGETAADTECQEGGPLGWVLCPILNLLRDAATNLVRGPIEALLETELITENEPLYNIWAGFRSVANIFFVIIFLIIIYSQAASVGLDAYTIKKMLPRLVIAAIAVQLSFSLAAFMVDVSNILGSGIDSLITGAAEAAGESTGFDVEGLTGFGQIGLVGGVAIAAVFYFGAISLLLAGAFLLLAIFLVLILRQLLIWGLIITAPLALVAWILPNTENLARRWFSNFARVLLMYPMIMGLWALGGVTNNIATNVAPQATGGVEEVMYKLIGIVAFFVPLFLIPFTFRFAGGAMAFAGGAITGLANRQGRGMIGKSMEKKGEKRADFGKRAGTDLFREGSRWDRLSGGALSKYGNVAARSVARPNTMWSRRARRETDGLRMAHANEAAKELQGWGISNHDALNALARVGADGNAMAREAATFRNNGNEAAAQQLESAFRLSKGRESHRAGALLLEASAGKLTENGSSIAAIDSFGGSTGYKAALANQIGEMATSAGQWEFARTTVGVDSQGRTFSQFHGNATAKQKAQKNFRDVANTLSDSDFYRMKTSSPKHIARGIKENLEAAHKSGDVGALRHAAQQASGLLRVGSPDAQEATLRALGGSDILNMPIEAVATDANGAQLIYEKGGPKAVAVDEKGNPRKAKTVRDILGGGGRGVDPLTDQLLADQPAGPTIGPPDEGGS